MSHPVALTEEVGTMRTYARAALWALVLGMGLATAALAQGKPTIAIMPAQYFQADPESAQNLTAGLVERFRSEGYRVIPMEKARDAFISMGLPSSHNLADPTALRFGRSLGVDLVAYPRLMSVGSPPAQSDARRIQAVVLLRVLNVRTGAPIYVRQVAHPFPAAEQAGP